MKFLKDLFFKYQRATWYIAQCSGELNKPLRFLPETLMLLTFISVNYDIKFNALSIIGFYIAILILSVLIGMFLTHIGVVKYNNKLANQQNEDIQYIRKHITKIKKRKAINIDGDDE